MKSLCVVTICNYKLNTLTDVPYQMTVGGAFVYVCESGRVKDFEQRSREHNAVRYNVLFSRGPRQPRYNGVAVYIHFQVNFMCTHFTFEKHENVLHIKIFHNLRTSAYVESSILIG